MKNKKWKEFDKLSRKCYMQMAGLEEACGCWDQAFEALKAVVVDERGREPEYAPELYLLDEDTDYEYDVQGWLEDYLDDLDMREDKEKLLGVCDELVSMFCWEEDKPSDIRFLKASALGGLGRKEEAAEFCKAWLAEEPDNLMAVTANVYALLGVKDMESAEALIKEHIHEDTECGDENDILFAAAVYYYKITGNKKEMKRLDKAREEYDKLRGQLMMEFDGDDGDEFMWDDEEYEDDDDLPFL